jgi:enterochelin esterase-like enzyme
VIIVGVANNDDRNSEYTPPGMGTNDPNHAEAKADAYAKFLVEELKPLIDSRYRTMPDRAHTAIGGSAMGGLVSLYVARTQPNVFGAVAVCSPWLRAPDGQKPLVADLTSDAKWLKSTRWYVDMGTAGGGAGYPPNTSAKKASDPSTAQAALSDARALVSALDAAGLVKGKDYVYDEVQGGEYNEPAWQARVEPLLRAMFPAAPATQPSASGTN